MKILKDRKLNYSSLIKFFCCILLASFLALSLYTPKLQIISKKIDFNKGVKYVEVDVRDHCTYELGVIFESKNEERTIQSFFGHAQDIKLSAIIDMSLYHSFGEEIISVKNYGGAVSGYRYGPDPLLLIVGRAYLDPGKYTAVIDIKSIEKDFSDFKSSIFVSKPPKVTCNRMKWFEFLVQ
ncbi:hypothetical protein [Endozoicomonas numazuensis]|uniref:DUF5625 domain-containing protein n=1 Tax=Endozoicomonas numazuensis TaxID=1137799 RepID=A0A081NHQ5_9GAMM|nr:hypothetical protein [Endozoicomonas numazuensis]KEQ17978.1 hypothetical protein GZ78_10220 [Endozoicomonas numazuensis]